jgi:hypothetical protein
MLHFPAESDLASRSRSALPQKAPVKSNWRAFQGQFRQHCGRSGLLVKAGPFHPGPSPATNWLVASGDPYANAVDTFSRCLGARRWASGSTAVIIR